MFYTLNANKFLLLIFSSIYWAKFKEIILRPFDRVKFKFYELNETALGQAKEERRRKLRNGRENTMIICSVFWTAKEVVR